MNIPVNINSKIALSLATVAAAAALIIGASVAFFSDTETSQDNTFTAGALDLKVDSEAHYNGSICEDGTWADGEGWPVGERCDGTWEETDLGETNQFFELTDVKPGDEGENTISLHVYNNDAWGRFVISGVTDLDESCTEPESEVDLAEPECLSPDPSPATTPGELAENITFYAWVDQGEDPGFQNIGADGEPNQEIDETEGDNVWQCGGLTDPKQFNPQEISTDCNEPLVILPGTVDENPSLDQTLPDETHNLWEALSSLYVIEGCTDEDGNTGYLNCQGIAQDGRMVGSTTYYFGLAWSVPDDVGNEAQTDSLNADLTFEAVQHRNNPTQQF